MSQPSTSRVVSSAGRTEQTITVVIVSRKREEDDAPVRGQLEAIGVGAGRHHRDEDIAAPQREEEPTLDAMADATSDSVKS